MGDISTWSPTDNSNTAAPPDGWPEGQSPASVNNCARAMMGAIRRWYDQVISGALVLPYLPIAGGTLTGALTAPYIHSTGDLDVSGTVTASYIHSVGDLAAAGNFSANQVTANLVHSLGNLNVDGTATAAQLTSTGNINASGSVAAAVNVIATNTIQGGFVHSLGNVLADGTVTGTSFIGNVSVPSNGPVTTGGTVTGGQVTSTGNASVAGAMTAGSVSASSNVTAAGSVTGGSMHSTGTMQVDGQCNFLQTVNIGPSGGYARFDGVGSYNISGSWLTFSDRAVKQEATIAPYERGLAAILALRPCAYRYRPELFGAEEAERVRYGLVADEVAPVVPEMVGEAVFGGRHLSTLNTGPLVFVLINSCRELAAQNAALAARITALEGNHV